MREKTKCILKTREINDLLIEIDERLKVLENNDKYLDDLSSILNNHLKKGDKDRYQRQYFSIVNKNKIQYEKIKRCNNKIELLMVEIKLLGEI